MAMSAEKQDLANSSFHDHKVKFAPQGWVPQNRRKNTKENENKHKQIMLLSKYPSLAETMRSSLVSNSTEEQMGILAESLRSREGNEKKDVTS